MNKDNWIRIDKDHLPKCGESVLVYNEKSAWPQVMVGYLISDYPIGPLNDTESNQWEFIASVGLSGDSEIPTHYMPLPEPPKS